MAFNKKTEAFMKKGVTKKDMEKKKAKPLHQGHRARLRKKLELGIDGVLEKHEILEIALFYSVTRRNTNDIAHELLNHFGSLENVLSAEREELEEVSCVGPRTAVMIGVLGEMLERCKKNYKKKEKLCIGIDSGKIPKYISKTAERLSKEGMYVTWVDGDGNAIVTLKIPQGDRNPEIEKSLKRFRNMVEVSGAIIIDFSNKNAQIPTSIQLEKVKALDDLFKINGITLFEYYVSDGKSLYGIK